MTATTKQARSNKNRKPATVQQPETVSFINLIQVALIARRQFCNDNNLAKQGDQLDGPIAAMTDAVVQAAQQTMTQTDFARVADIIATSDKKAPGYEQVKSIVKVCDVIKNVAQGVTAKSNNFNDCIRAMLKNGNHATVSELIVAQSNKARESFAGKCRESFACRSGGYSIATSSSQASQVRQVLKVLGFADVQKGKREDDANLNEYGILMLTRAYK